MGKPTGFLEWGREAPPKREKAERLRDSREFVLPLAPPQARQQAGRCMDCGVPFCHQGCPLGNQIPDFNDLVYKDRWRQAFVNLTSTNNFPEFTGRLCPAPCEASCVLAIDQDPVSIEQLEKEIIERAFAEGWVVPRPPQTRTGRTVGVVGSGPAGLAAAAQLNQAGHEVVVYERDDRLGGLLRYGIPDFKLEKSVIDRRVAILEKEGVRFETGVDAGGRVPWADLKAKHEALVVAVGARVARELDVPGRKLHGVHLAMDFLERANRKVAGDTTPIIDAAGLNVIVLGGGDTGSDCVGTSHRQGAKSVRQIELLPAPPDARAGDNPWPQWPMVFRTSSSQEEGGAREFALMTKELVGANGRVEKLVAVRVEFVKGADGRTTLRETGEQLTLPCDLVILALGFTGPDVTSLRDQLGVALDGRGNVQVDPSFATSAPGVWSAGDARRGASLIVWAISDGRETARAVDAHLRETASRLPRKGQDVPFGGR